MPYGEITSAEAKEIRNIFACHVEICTKAARELRIYGSPEMLSSCYMKTFMLLSIRDDPIEEQGKQEHQTVQDRIENIKKLLESGAVHAPSPRTTARPNADDAPTPTTTARSSKYDKPQANAPMPPPKTPMPKKEKQHETDEGGNTQPPSEPQVIQLFEAIRLQKKAEDEQSWSSIEHAFASPKSSTSAQGPGQSHAKDSPLIIPPNPGGQTMAIQTLVVPTPPAQLFGPVPTFPFQPTKKPEPPTNGESSMRILKPPPGLGHVIEEKKKEDAFRWQ